MNTRNKTNTAPLGQTNTTDSSTLIRNLAIVFLIVFIEFLIMGASLGVLPPYIHQSLHLSNLWVGIVIGAQYVTTLITRQFAGKMADTKGGKRSLILGILFSVVSGAMLFLGVSQFNQPLLSLVCLIGGRIMLGVGESFLMVGLFRWSFTLVGFENTGKVLVWGGMGMYGGMACGAPMAAYFQASLGIKSIFLIAACLPVLVYGAMRLFPEVELPAKVEKMPFGKVLRLIWPLGTAMALASIGFGGIASFISLYFIQNNWQHAPLALTAYGACYILVRLFLSNAPDRFGGTKVALLSLPIEIIGQLIIWAGINGPMTIVGAAITGLGLSLVFPALGQLAVQKVESASGGMAIAAYSAFFDLGLGVTAPLAGIVAGSSHYQRVYLLGGFAVVISIILVYWELTKLRKDKGPLVNT